VLDSDHHTAHQRLRLPKKGPERCGEATAFLRAKLSLRTVLLMDKARLHKVKWSAASSLGWRSGLGPSVSDDFQAVARYGLVLFRKQAA
jgi:hypothetical protein